jgi:hypothetical protein
MDLRLLGEPVLRGVVDVSVGEIEIFPSDSSRRSISSKAQATSDGRESRRETRLDRSPVGARADDSTRGDTPNRTMGNSEGQRGITVRREPDVLASYAEEAVIPRTLSRYQVTDALRQVSLLVRNCGVASSPDVALVDVVVSGSTGRVVGATVREPLRRTSEGRCISRAVRQARFPRFQDEALNVPAFPFVLR